MLLKELQKCFEMPFRRPLKGLQSPLEDLLEGVLKAFRRLLKDF
jgi:hypothetical protein